MNTPDTEREGFEKYLEHVCFQANPTVLDDDMPDFFDNWLGSQNGEDYIRLADAYASSRDTYWKERVEKAELTVINRVMEYIESHEDMGDYSVPCHEVLNLLSPTPITNKDNLK